MALTESTADGRSGIFQAFLALCLFYLFKTIGREDCDLFPIQCPTLQYLYKCATGMRYSWVRCCYFVVRSAASRRERTWSDRFSCNIRDNATVFESISTAQTTSDARWASARPSRRHERRGNGSHCTVRPTTLPRSVLHPAALPTQRVADSTQTESNRPAFLQGQRINPCLPLAGILAVPVCGSACHLRLRAKLLRTNVPNVRY
jgi:hypothetical protein